MMDANNNVLNGKYTKRLPAEGLEMKEAVHTAVPKMGPNTHSEGSGPINRIWYTNDLEMENVKYNCLITPLYPRYRELSYVTG